MGSRSYWLWKIQEQTGVTLRDTHDLHKHLEAKGLHCQELRKIDQIEAIAHYFGVEEARPIAIAVTPKARKKRVSKSRKSKLSDAEIFNLRQQGLTCEAIAKLAGISRQAVSERLQQKYAKI